MKNLLLIALLSYFHLSCQKDKIDMVEVPEETEVIWHINKNFIDEKAYQLNSYVDDNNFYFVSDRFLSMLSVSTGEVSSLILPYKSPENSKTPIFSDYFVTLPLDKNGIINFYPTQFSVFSEHISFDLKAHDPSFHKFDQLYFENGEIFAINDNGTFFAPYIAIDDSKRPSIKGILIKIESEKDEQGISRLSIANVNSLNFSEDYIQGFIFHVNSIDDVFFVSSSWNTYMIRPDGKVSKVHSRVGTNDKPGFHKVFKFQDALYASVETGYMFKSVDQGNTWNIIYSSIPLEIISMNFIEIEGELVAYGKNERNPPQNNIYKVSLNQDNISILELDDQGFNQDIVITSLSQLEDKVYCTSLSGVYYKSINEFFTAKQGDQLIVE